MSAAIRRLAVVNGAVLGGPPLILFVALGAYGHHLRTRRTRR